MTNPNAQQEAYEMALATARIQKAAPQLYEACKIAYDAILGVTQSGWEPKQIEPYLKQLNKALALADGKNT